MKILALEFSSNRRSVAIADGKDVLARVETDDVKKPPLTLIDEALKKANLDRTAIETIALGIGPGSYTGIRSAIATAQGWQLARYTNLLPISSAEILAATVAATGHRGEAQILIYAQRNEFFHATWQIEDPIHKHIPSLGMPQEFFRIFGNNFTIRNTSPLRIIDTVASTKLEFEKNVFCPDSFVIERKYLFSKLEAKFWDVVAGPGQSCFQHLHPNAAVLAQLAADRTDFQPGESIEPIYLRPIEFTKAPPPRQLD